MSRDFHNFSALTYIPYHATSLATCAVVGSRPQGPHWSPQHNQHSPNNQCGQQARGCSSDLSQNRESIPRSLSWRRVEKNNAVHGAYEIPSRVGWDHSPTCASEHLGTVVEGGPVQEHRTREPPPRENTHEPELVFVKDLRARETETRRRKKYTWQTTLPLLFRAAGQTWPHA